MLRRFLLRVIFSLSATATSLLAQAPAVTIDGSSTVYPITKLAGEAFEQETKGDVKVNVAFSGTTGGFRKFLKGEIDIADASRPILTVEMEEAKANGIEYIEIEGLPELFLNDAGAYINKVNYMPLSAIAYRTAIADIDGKKMGTRFGGEPVVGIAMHDLFTRARR